MSSTLAFPPVPTPEQQQHHLFSAPNLSSISLVVNVSGGAPPTPAKGADLFRTPKRRDVSSLLSSASSLASESPGSGPPGSLVGSVCVCCRVPDRQ